MPCARSERGGEGALLVFWLVSRPPRQGVGVRQSFACRREVRVKSVTITSIAFFFIIYIY